MCMPNAKIFNIPQPYSESTPFNKKFFFRWSKKITNNKSSFPGWHQKERKKRICDCERETDRKKTEGWMDIFVKKKGSNR